MKPMRDSLLSKRGIVAFAILILAALFVLPATTAQSAPGDGKGKLSGEVRDKIRTAAPDDLVSVIVQTYDDPTDAQMARLHGRGGLLKARFNSVRGYSAKVPASQLEAFADDPEIAHVSFDTPVKAHMDVAYPAVAADVAYTNFDLKGKGVGVAVIDTGAAAHADLARPMGHPQVVEVEIVGHEAGLADYFGHGTHVAGIINGNGSSSSGKNYFRTFKGIAPDTQILSVRALYPDGTGYTSDIIAGIDWAIRYRTTYNIRVLNLSLGHPVYESYTTDPMCRALRAAYDAGILAVVAAGNDGRVGTGFGTITSPGNEPTALTVGAMDDGNTVTTTDDVLAPYSSKGPSLIDYVVKPDLVAPGTAIVSLRVPGSYFDTSYHQFTLKIGDYKYDPANAASDGDYYSLSGTSMATPLVAGAAALLFGREPALNPATVKARLMLSATKDGRLVFETGAGYLNVDAALRATGTLADASSPLAVLASDGVVYCQDTALIWGAEWTMPLVWGSSKGSASGLIWGDGAAGTLSALGAIWSKTKSVGTEGLIWNDSCTASGLIWNYEASSLDSSSGTADVMGAIWGGKK